MSSHHLNLPFQSYSLILVLMIVLARLMSCLAGGKIQNIPSSSLASLMSSMSFSGCWTQKECQPYHYEIFKVESALWLSYFISQVSNEKDNVSLPMSDRSFYCETKWIWNRSAIICSTRQYSCMHNVLLDNTVSYALLMVVSFALLSTCTLRELWEV